MRCALVLSVFAVSLGCGPSNSPAPKGPDPAKPAARPAPMSVEDPERAAAERAKRVEAAGALNTGIEAFKRGDDARAKAQLERAIELDPTLHQAHYYLGLTFNVLGEDVRAATSLAQSCRRDPEFFKCYNALAKLYHRWRFRAEARAVLEVGLRHIKSGPERGGLLANLGILLAIDGNHLQAIAAFNQAETHGADKAEMQYHRGMSLADLGDDKGAAADLTAYVASGPHSMPQLSAANARLMRLSKRTVVLSIPKAPTLAATELPPIPKLTVPANPGPGIGVRALQVEMQKHLNRDVEARGVVIWIYDCATALRVPGRSAREVARLLRDEPERCQRPHFILGHDSSTPVRDGLWVVEVPRPPRPDERKMLDKETLRNWPKVPKLRVGDRVLVKGKFATRSPRGFANSAGLIVYGSIRPQP